MSEEIFEELANAVINCKADLSKAAAQKEGNERDR